MRQIEFILFILINALFLSCGEKLNELGPVNPPMVLTIKADTSALDEDGVVKLVGSIVSTGDGFIEHGHVKSTINPPDIDDDGADVSSFGPKNRQDTGRFTSTFQISQRGRTYYIRAYAIDEYEREVYDTTRGGLIVVNRTDVRADFTIMNNNCFAPCTVTFTNTSENVEADKVDYCWDFGDGSPIEKGALVNHQYQFPGSYNVKLSLVSNVIPTDTLGSTVESVTIRAISFERSFAGLTEGVRVISLSNGNYALLGFIRDAISFETSIVYLHLDRMGNTLDSVVSPLRLSNFDTPTDMIQLDNQELVIVGSTFNSTQNNNDFYYAKLSVEGIITAGPSALVTTTDEDVAYGIVETNNGVIIVGSSSIEGKPGIYLHKTRPNLAVVSFSKKIPSSRFEIAFDVELTDDNGFAICGQSSTSAQTASADAFYYKFDENGVLQSALSWLSSGSNFEQAQSMSKRGNGNLLLLGSTASIGDTQGDFLLQEVTQEGSPVRDLSFGLSNEAESGIHLQVLSDDSYVVTGIRSQKAFINYVNSMNSPEWGDGKLLGTSGVNKINDMQLANDGGYIATGTLNQVLFLFKLDAQGN